MKNKASSLFFYYSQIILILSMLWIVLFGKIDAFVLISAPIVSIISIYYTEKVLIGDKLYFTFPLNLIKLLRFYFFLLIEIYRSGFKAAKSVILHQSNCQIVDITTDLESDLDKVVLANAITLTPGTITLDLEGQKLSVLWLNCTTKEPTQAGKLIKSNIEKLL